MYTFPHDSFLTSWLNIFPSIYTTIKKKGYKRSPFPSIIDNPNHFDIINNFGRAEYGAFFVYNIFSITYLSA